MYAAWLAVGIVGAYLCGSVSFAIILTRALTGQDIRGLGNRNPGTANVGRTLGRGWGALVFMGDMIKSLVPMLAARLLVFTGGDSASILAVYAIGCAAIVGHCRPALHGFRGGGGVASSLPIYFFFTPVEMALSIALGAAVTFLFVRNVAFRVGRWMPMIFVTIAPLLTLILSLTVPVDLTGPLRIGGEPWSVIAGLFATTLLLHGFNLRLTVASLTDPRAQTARH